MCGIFDYLKLEIFFLKNKKFYRVFDKNLTKNINFV